MSAFSTRLRELRTSKNITQKQLAESTGLSERACQSYELDEREPRLSVINKLADFFEVTTDYLLGRTDQM
ncbi:MAG: helix-turn-helix transcriptional regulator [Oscillospiraceae bacterium]|nr:helix-turn-helix transcriptional regulator [Oscillospiraceae bacterium]